MDSNEPISGDEDFHLGAAVYSSDGTEIGKLSRLIVDKAQLADRALVAKAIGRLSGDML